MADYNLYGLNHRDFEHIVQALLKKHVATGMTPFGDGKDGGREATFKGIMDYPSKSESWDGYLVAQCKFCAKPKYDTKKDGEWVHQQLKKELNKYLENNRLTKKPEYYLFVTNVSLTAVPETGGKDKAIKIIEDFSKKLKLKGYDIWSNDELCRFLDDNEEIRKAYAGFITTGDVLFAMMEFLTGDISPDFYDVMGSFLQKELVYERYAKLESAGKIRDQQVALPRVFVDLPVTDKLEGVSKGNEADSRTFIECIVNISSSKLNRLDANECDLLNIHEYDHHDRSCYVLVGGPGQGKSTLAQFLCQLYRAAILKNYPAGRLAPQASEAISLMEKCASGYDYFSKVNKRFPFLVQLNKYASLLSNNPSLSLINYIKEEISLLGSSEINLSDIKCWLKNYPWLLILDGLDEVPASSNRNDVLKNIEAFRIDAANLDADILIIATTRPQNYNEELHSSNFKHLYLRPLSPDYALHYGNKLADARSAGDERRKSNIIRRLESACKNEFTAKLMQSPLQITIMATLVERIGEPPRQRYRLFELYYRTIYEREIGREGALSAILSERQTDIDIIHYRSGLILQCRSEIAGGTVSELDDIEFEKIVEDRLSEIDESGINKKLLLEKIADGTLQRLVFLIRPQDGKVAFEIRSLQEFMASEALLKGDDETVKKRLREIAPIAHWRNVFLFAVGKCFAEMEHHLDSIDFMCRELNDADYSEISEIALWGSRLSLDILYEGIAQPNPKYERQHALNALKVIELNNDSLLTELSEAYHDRLEDVYRKIITDYLHQKSKLKKDGALSLLKLLADKKKQWAINLINQFWPKDKESQISLLTCSLHSQHDFRNIKEWSIDKYVKLVPCCDCSTFNIYRFEKLEALKSKFGTAPSWFPLAMNIQNLTSPYKPICLFDEEGELLLGLYMGLMSISSDKDRFEAFEKMPFEDTSWAKYIATAKFLKNPNYKSLSETLAWLAKYFCNDVRYHRTIWPIDACYSIAKRPEDLLELSEKASRKELGDINEWIDAEERWIEKGVKFDELKKFDTVGYPFDNTLNFSGFPLLGASIVLPERNDNKLYKVLFSLFDSFNTKVNKIVVAQKILEFLTFRYQPRSRKLNIEISPQRLKSLIEILYTDLNASQHSYFIGHVLYYPELPEVLDNHWISFFNWLGMSESEFLVRSIEWPYTDQIVKKVKEDPNKCPGLLNILVHQALSDDKISLPKGFFQNWKIENETAKINSILLRIAIGDWDIEEIDNLTETIVGLLERDKISEFYHAISLINPTVSDPHIVEALFVQLYRILNRCGDTKTSQISVLLWEFEKYLNSRKSRICQGTKSKQLKLDFITQL